MCEDKESGGVGVGGVQGWPSEGTLTPSSHKTACCPLSHVVIHGTEARVERELQQEAGHRLTIQ